MSTDPELAPKEEQTAETTSASKPEREPSQQETAMLIADRLGERDHVVRAQIVYIVRALGRTQARALLEETLQVEAQGGMLLPDGSRRRTIGGVFFQLAYTTGRLRKDGRPLQRYYPSQKQIATDPTRPRRQEGAGAAPAFPWDERLGVIETIGAEKGRASVKITLVGKPGKYVEKGTCVVAVVQSDKIPALPKGLPEPAGVKTNYVVYVALKQWRAIAGTLEDAEDVLIIEGFPQLDAKTGTIAVFATSVTSKKLQAAKRQKPS